MEERRQKSRMTLCVPVQVEGHDADGTAWTEMSGSVDVSEGGVAFELEHPVDKGSLLRLSLPLPKRFRHYDPVASTYKIHALVRAVQGKGRRRVGVRFMGQHPPKGHSDRPGLRYRMPGEEQPRQERRDRRRLEIFINVVLRRLDGPGEERTIAENLGRGGARTLTSLPVAKGEVVDFEELNGGFRTRAEVRNIYLGADRIPRLNLRFLDGTAPERLVPS
jgi:hypothetical protein